MKAARRTEQNYFPQDGLVLQYRPLIIKQARWYSRKYFTDFFHTLQQAVQLARLAEKKFDPARASFGTLLQWELQRLHRWCQREYRQKHVLQASRYSGGLQPVGRRTGQGRPQAGRTPESALHR